MRKGEAMKREQRGKLLDYQRRQLRDFFKLEKWEWADLYTHARRQAFIFWLTKSPARAYYRELARICKRKLNKPL